MMTEDGMEMLVAALVARGYSQEIAEDYAIRLGDTIEEDDQGRWVVRADDGTVLDRIKPVY